MDIMNALSHGRDTKAQYNELMLNNILSLVSRIGTVVEEKLNGEYSIGKVVNNKDPSKLRRLQIRVTGMHDGIQDSMLPWVIPTEQFNAGFSVVIPEVGSFVKVYTANGDENDLRYTSKIPLQTDAAGRQSDAFGDEYPDWVLLFETEMGDYCQYNRKSGEFEFSHAKGMTLHIDSEGNLKILNIGGSIDIDSAENISITAGGDILLKTEEADSKITISSLSTIVLETPDANRWIPNTIPVCPFTGLPHGGLAAGFMSIKGDMPPIEIDDNESEPTFAPDGTAVPG